MDAMIPLVLRRRVDKGRGDIDCVLEFPLKASTKMQSILSAVLKALRR